MNNNKTNKHAKQQQTKLINTINYETQTHDKQHIQTKNKNMNNTNTKTNKYKHNNKHNKQNTIKQQHRNNNIKQ